MSVNLVDNGVERITLPAGMTLTVRPVRPGSRAVIAYAEAPAGAASLIATLGPSDTQVSAGPFTASHVVLVEARGIVAAETSVSGDGVTAALAAYAPGGPAPGVSAVSALDVLLYSPTVQQRMGTRGLRRDDFFGAARRTRVARTVYYVSNAAGNGMPLGSDANAGTSRLAPKLTYASAYAAAGNGDTIIFNGSSTPYELGTGHVIGKSLFLTTNVYRGATVQQDDGTCVLNAGIGGVVIGPLVVDSARTSTGRSQYTIFASASGQRRGTALYGTKLIGGSLGYADFNHEILLYGVECENAVANLAPILDLKPASGTAARVLNCRINGRVRIAPAVDGVAAEVAACDVSADTTAGGVQTLVAVTGASTVTITDVHGHMAGTATWAGVNVLSHATRPCASVVIDNVTVAGAGTSATAGGYGIAVGAEVAGSANVGTVAITRCEVSHVNHGVFCGYGVTGGYVQSCVVRDSVIGLIRKGEANPIGAPVQIRSSVVIGGTLTGGALRAKETTTAEFVNNTVVFDAASTSGGVGVYLTDSSTATLRANVFSGGGGAMPRAVWVLAGNTLAAAGNLYHAASFGSTAWQTPDVTTNSFATWSAFDPGSVNADPQFLGAGDYRPALAGPATANPVAATDFDGLPHNARGAFAAA